MAMTAGDDTVPAGSMARAIYDEVEAEFGASPSPELDAQRKQFCAAVARAVVGYIQTNADITLQTTHVGLQTSTSAGSPTAGPGAPVTALAPVIT